MRSIFCCIVMILWHLGGIAGSFDQDGRSYSPDDLGGGYTVIDFSASWCNPCWKLLPRLQVLAEQQPRIRFLVVSVDQRQQGRDRLVRELKLKTPVIWDEGHVWAEYFQPEGMPTTLVVDPNGQVIYRHVGFSPKKWRDLEELLAQLSARAGASADMGK